MRVLKLFFFGKNHFFFLLLFHLYLSSFSLPSSLSSSSCLLSCLASCLSSCLVLSCLSSCLVLSRVLSFILSCLLVLSCLVLSCLVLSLSCFSVSVLVSLSCLCLCLRVMLSLCLSLSLSLRVMLWVVLCGVVSLWSWCCWWSWSVFVCVCCGTLKKRGKTRVWIQKRLRVYIQNVPVCTCTTRTCVETCARGAGTHGDVLNVHGAQGQFCLLKFAHVWLSRASEVHQRKFWILPIFKFENRLRTTCPRFLQSFALLDKAVQFQQY